MKHVILLAYVLLFASGFAGIGAAAIARLKSRNRYLLAYLAYLIVATTWIVLTTISYYRSAILFSWNLRGHLVQATVANAAGGALYFFLIWVGYHYLGLGTKGWRVLPPLAVGGTYLVGAVLPWLLASSPPEQYTLFEAERRLFFLLSTLAMAHLGLLGLLRLGRTTDPEERRINRAFSIVLLLFLPLSALEFALEFGATSSFHPFSLDHVFYFLLNLLTVVFTARYILASRTAPGAVLTDIPAELLRRLGITERERDIAILIGQGLANKQIGAKLEISEKTVRTHIYNLFRKCAVSSRIELLNRLRNPV